MNVVRNSPGPAPSSAGPGPSLTPNELVVLSAAAEGDTYEVIARRLGVQPKSVNSLAHRLARKLGARSITHAVFLACRAGILDGRPRRHGDHAGYAAHVARDEEPCEACWAGERAYRAARRRVRKEAKGQAA